MGKERVEILNNNKKQPGILRNNIKKQQQQTYEACNFSVLSALYICISQIWNYFKIGVL